MSNDDSLLSEEEKQQLLKVAETVMTSELEDELADIEIEAVDLQQKISVAQSKLTK